jgi:transposase
VVMGDTRLEPLVLTEDERRTLENWVKRRSTAQGLALRARIVLACAQGGSNLAVAVRLRVNRKTVSKWRARFVRERLGGLTGEPRPGVSRTITDAQVEEVVVRTLEEVPGGSMHLVKAGAGRPGGHLAVQRAPDLARIRTAALADRDLQDLPGPAADRQDPRRRGPALLRCAFPEGRRSMIRILRWVQMTSVRSSNATRSRWRLGTSVATS